MYKNDYETSIKKKLYEENNTFTTTEISFKKYLSENNNAKLINEELEKHNKVLLVAPTGSGKTYTILKEVCELDKNSIHLFFTPKRAQSQQNENDYNVKCITSGTNIDYFIKLDKRLKKFVSKEDNYSLVFDKSNEIIEILDLMKIESPNNKVKKNNLKFKIYIDEAHTLISNYNFRNNAIRTLLKLIDKVNYKILYITATAESLLNIPELLIERVILAEQENFKSNVKHIEIIHNRTKKDFYEFSYNIMLKELKNGNKIFFRLNNKDKTKHLLNNFETETIEKGRKAKTIFVNSEEKEFNIIKNEYNNKMYHHIITENTLINGYDIYATTSLFDEGISINKAPDNTIIYFLVDNINNMNIDNIIQFSNRFRFKIQKMVIIINSPFEYVEKNDFLSYENFIFKYLTLNEIELNKFKNSIFDLEQIKLFLKTIKQNEEYGEKKNCLEVINNNLIIDKFQIYNLSYNKYQQQYYYNINRMKTFLINELKTYVSTTSYTEIEEIKINLKEERESNKIIFERVKKGILELDKNDFKILTTILLENENNKTKCKVKNAKTENNIINDLLSLERLTQSLKKGYSLGIELNILLKEISKSKKQADFEKYVLYESIKYYKDIFIKNNYDFEIIKGSNILYTILKECFSFSCKKYNVMKSKTITEKEINIISKNLKVSKKQVIEYIKIIFCYEEIEVNKKYILRKIKK